MELLDKSLVEIRDAIHSGDAKSADVVHASLERIKKLNPKINAFITQDAGQAIKHAEQVDKDRAAGKKLAPLAGVPIGIKDNYCTHGVRTTAASKILENFIPPYSATVVLNLERAGAISVGKTNLDEFAMGSSNENSAFGLARNPWNFDYVPGGSSGGSAAAVAARMVPGSTGSDTGGSIRLPAHYCGVAGIKPTYGRISRYGIVAFASSLDQAGPIAATTQDCALMLEAMSGYDKKDATTSDRAVPAWAAEIKTDLRGIRLGLPKEYFVEGGMSDDVRKTVNETIQKLKDRGAVTVDVELPLTEYCISVYYIVATCEASSNLARYDGVRFGARVPSKDLEEMYKRSRGAGFGSEVKRRIMIGTYALSSGYYEAYYNKACLVRRRIVDDYKKAFSKCDVIIGPVSTSTAFKLGERNQDPLKMYLNDIYTTSINLAGLPGMSVPAGFGANGLPIGVQLIGPHFEEQRLFNIAQAIEETTQDKKKVLNGLY